MYRAANAKPKIKQTIRKAFKAKDEMQTGPEQSEGDGDGMVVVGGLKVLVDVFG